MPPLTIEFAFSYLSRPFSVTRAYVVVEVGSRQRGVRQVAEFLAQVRRLEDHFAVVEPEDVYEEVSLLEDEAVHVHECEDLLDVGVERTSIRREHLLDGFEHLALFVDELVEPRREDADLAAEHDVELGGEVVWLSGAYCSGRRTGRPGTPGGTCARRSAGGCRTCSAGPAARCSRRS
jgi:hypothetical protein